MGDFSAIKKAVVNDGRVLYEEKEGYF